MWLLQRLERRRAVDDVWLGAWAALVAGLVNVCSVMIFFAFSSNVTGHVASFAEEIVKGHWYQVWVLLAWMSLFVLGAFVANLSVTLLGARNLYAGHSAPLLLQAAILCAVGFYGHEHYLETLTETELLVGVLLFTMGLQNSAVASVTGSVVRTTHLTGLFTDLAMELSMIMQPRFRGNRQLRERFVLHVTILATYLLGGLLGGIACQRFGFHAFYLASALLMTILLHDYALLWRRASLTIAGDASHSERGPSSVRSTR